MNRILLLSAGAALFFPALARAETLSVCNETGEDIRVAASIKTFFDRSWGWTRIKDDACQDVAQRVHGGYIYLYVEFQPDPFETQNNIPYRPKDDDVKYADVCVNLRTHFDYLYNDRGCAEGMVEKEFFESVIPRNASRYRLTLK